MYSLQNYLVGVSKCNTPTKFLSKMGLLTDAVTTEVSIEIGTVDVDFAADLGEGDDALVAVVLPCLGRDSEQLSRDF